MLKNQLDSITFDANLESSLLKQQKDLEKQLEQLQKEISGLESSVRNVDFQYSDPEPNFDRSKVKGFVATLFSIPKEHHNKANALEICAGGKLFQVLVESSDVGTKLLKKGKLAKRVTIIPLNQINAFQVQAERISTAKKLAPGAVDLALTLIGSDADLAKAMAYVFGSTLICKGNLILKLDSDTAKLVTFDKRVNMRSVTYDGDTFDPSGLLSGGAKSQQSGSLLKIQSLLELKGKRMDLEVELNKVIEHLGDIQSSKKLHETHKQEYDLKKHELDLHENRLNNNPHFKVIQNLDNLFEEHKGCKVLLERAKEKEEISKKKIVEIEKEMLELNDNRESKVESLKVILWTKSIEKDCCFQESLGKVRA
jgi:structural maintenance of chromosome 2